MNIYVGNLSTDVTEESLKNFFAGYGSTSGIKVIKDVYSGASKGFAFLEISGQTEALKAINELNGKNLNGKKIIVNEARPKTQSTFSSSSRSSKSPYGGGGKRW